LGSASLCIIDGQPTQIRRALRARRAGCYRSDRRKSFGLKCRIDQADHFMSKQMLSLRLTLRLTQYAILLDNAAHGSHAHIALSGAHSLISSDDRSLICSAKAIEELLDLAERVCPDTIVEISRQIQSQLGPFNSIVDYPRRVWAHTVAKAEKQK